MVGAAAARLAAAVLLVVFLCGAQPCSCQHTGPAALRRTKGSPGHDEGREKQATIEQELQKEVRSAEAKLEGFEEQMEEAQKGLKEVSGELSEEKARMKKMREGIHAVTESIHAVADDVGVAGEDEVEFGREGQSEESDQSEEPDQSGEAEDITSAQWEEEHPVRWTQGIILMGVVLSLCGICVIGCGGCVCCGDNSIFSEFCGTSTTLENLGYSSLSSDDLIRLLVRREARYMLLLPLLPLAAAPWTDCENGTPTVVYLLYAPLLIRSKLIEISILRALEAPMAVYVSVLMGAFEHFDWFTDGAFPVQAWACDAHLTPGFAASLRESWMTWMAPSVYLLHFYGWAAVLFVASASAQQALVSFDDNELQTALAADVAGFAAVSKMKDKPGPAGIKLATIFISAGKVFLENCLQLWLQSSGFALSFAQTSEVAKWKLLASMSVGLLSATSKSLLSMADLIRAAICDPSSFFFLSFNLLALLMVAWTAAKLYYAYSCPEHVWNITSGCVTGVGYFV